MKIRYKGVELEFDTIPTSDQIEARYRELQAADPRVATIIVPRPTELARDGSPRRPRELEDLALAYSSANVPESDGVRQMLVDEGVRVRERGTERNAAEKIGGLLYDGRRLEDPAGVDQAFEWMSGQDDRLEDGAKIVVLTGKSQEAVSAAQAACWEGLETAVRSLAAKLGGRGITANLLEAESAAPESLRSALRYFLSRRSAYVTAQRLRVGAAAETSASHDRRGPPVALVTGGTRGIGRAIVERFVAEGFEVIAVGRPGSPALEKLQGQEGVFGLGVDVGAPEAAAMVASAVADHDGVDCVIHNAGLSGGRSFAEMTDEMWELHMAVNFDGPLRITEELLGRELVGPGGRIVFTSSVAGISGSPSGSSYAASKSAQLGAIRSLAPGLAARGITINAVAPGITQTDMHEEHLPGPAGDFAQRMNMLGQIGHPTDVANAVAFLCEPASRGITGQTLRVCGGYYAGA